MTECVPLLDSDRFDEDSRGNRSSLPLTTDTCSEEGHPRPQRRERTKFNRIQSLELEKEFQRNPYPGIQRRIQLACKLAIDESRIQVTTIVQIVCVFSVKCFSVFFRSLQVWFANRRAKGRRRVVTKDYHQSVHNVKTLVKGRNCVFLKDTSPSETSDFNPLYHFVNTSPNKNHFH